MDSTIIQSDISQKILTLRGEQVILDRDLALLYGVTTKRLNEQVKRNIERFPEDFMFQLSEKEKKELVAKCDRLEMLKHSTVMPYAFTEQGVYMLAEYCVGVHPCVYPFNIHQNKILNMLSKGQIHRSAPTGDF